MNSARWNRLRTAVRIEGSSSAYIVIVSKDFEPEAHLIEGSAIMHMDELMATPALHESLEVHSSQMLEIDLASSKVDLATIRALNQQRQQFLRECGSVIIRIAPHQAPKFARTAVDLWKWATIFDLAEVSEYLNGRRNPARGRLDEDVYAPELKETEDFTGPSHPIMANPHEER